MLLQAATMKDPRFLDVPNVLDEAKTVDDRQALQFMFDSLELGRTYADARRDAEDRVALLRSAFAQTMMDPEFTLEAKSFSSISTGLTATQQPRWSDRLYATPRVAMTGCARR